MLIDLGFLQEALTYMSSIEADDDAGFLLALCELAHIVGDGLVGQDRG